VPRAADGLAFHRRLAVLSILVALFAGSLDAMLWRAAQRSAARSLVDARRASDRLLQAARAQPSDAFMCPAGGEGAWPLATGPERMCAATLGQRSPD